MKTIHPNVGPVIAGEVVVCLNDFIRHALLVDQRFNANGAGIRSAAKIDDAIEAKTRNRENTQMLIELEDADYDRLLEAVENPQPMQGMPPYPLRPARLCAAFLAAIKSAK